MEPNIKDRESSRMKAQDLRLLFSNDQNPCVPWSLVSLINTEFNGILENYYRSTCCPTFGDFILGPGNSQKALYFQISLMDLLQRIVDPDKPSSAGHQNVFPLYPIATKGQQILTV